MKYRNDSGLTSNSKHWFTETERDRDRDRDREVSFWNSNVPSTAQGHLIAKWVYICPYMGINIRLKNKNNKAYFWDPYLYLQSNFSLLRNFLNSAF